MVLILASWSLILLSIIFCYVNKGQSMPWKLGMRCVNDFQCTLMFHGAICSSFECICKDGHSLNGRNCTPSRMQDDANEDKEGYCSPVEVKKDGMCYLRKRPGELCHFSEQCIDAGSAQYYCIASLCQIPPECQPGHTAVGAECFPFSVTGGACTHPNQCLSGSICINGVCSGPCDENQLFVRNQCLDYEGAGCIATSCVVHKCPRSFPSCNYVPQKADYLCCDRPIVTPVQCPHPNSVPQMNSLSGEVATCMHDSCSPGYSCQFSTYGRGSYVCCSNIPIVPNSTANRRRFSLKRRGKQKQVTEKQPTKYKSAYVFLYHCCRDRECRMRRKQIMLICGRLFTSNNAEII